METNTSGYVVPADQGPVWDMEPGRPTIFKLLSEQTGDSVAVFEEVVPVDGGTPLHVHHTSDEVIYILAGEFTINIGEHVTTADTGAWIFIPRGVAHAWKNSGDADGRAFFIFTPAEGVISIIGGRRQKSRPKRWSKPLGLGPSPRAVGGPRPRVVRRTRSW